jgi:NAD(P)H-dependent FMN reductase
MPDMLKIAIIIGSTRPVRKGEAVGKWVLERAQARGDAEYELIDLREVNLPFLNEPQSPARGEYAHPHTKAWSERIAPFDAFVFVTPEYNHGMCAPLKNALDTLYKEWNNKAAAFVGYGTNGGARAVEQLRQVAIALQMAPVRSQVAMSIFTDWDKDTFKPAEIHERSLKATLDQVVAWGGAVRTLRSKPA